MKDLVGYHYTQGPSIGTQYHTWECLVCGKRGEGDMSKLTEHLREHISLDDFDETNCNWGE